MHLHFERNTNAKCDCSILSLTWMGKVPDELPEDEGWKLNRTNYYQEGWLATGNVRGIVGVTFTTSHCKKSVDVPLRTNYNLRGHRSEVILVKWNEPYQKLASCDSSGIIFVWIKYEGRWSIELINDRNTPVTHFSWSHDGRMALICYQDGFVLVGSVAGQRYWSSMLTLKSTITCGIWTPDDQQVYFGTSSGQIIVMDVHGAMVSQVQLSTDAAITGMAWSAEKFKMEETDENDPNSSAHTEDRVFVLAVSLHNGYIFLMKSFDDVSPIQVHTGLTGPLFLEWSNSRELLAVAGSVSSPVPTEHRNVLKFYSDSGVLLYCTLLPFNQSPVTALTWGHNDKRLFIATGCQVHVAWVSRRVASLQLMCRLRVHAQLRSESQLKELPLPPRIKALISNLFAQTIRCCVPNCQALREFVSRPPQGSARLHCTMIRHGDHETTNGNAGVNGSLVGTGTCYTLYLEYLGGLVPLLKGKRTSKIRPEFVIFDPQVDDTTIESGDSSKSSGTSSNYPSGSNVEGMSGVGSSSDTDIEDGCASPRVQRRRRRRRHRRAKSNGSTTNGQITTNNYNFSGETSTASTSAFPHPLASIFGGPEAEPEDLTYLDTLPEDVRLVEVTSNIWGTKFKIHGLAPSVPANLGQVTYKTSLLHLQPRQMTLVMTELRDDIAPGPDPNFNPNLFSEDEEEINQTVESQELSMLPEELGIPIAPMTPRPPSVPRFQRQIPSPLAGVGATSSERLQRPPSLAKAESYEESFDLVNFCETLRESQNSNNNGARSKLVCDGAVPTLQSPKNSVAPSEVMIESSTSLTVNSTERSKLSLTLNLEQHELRPVVVKRQEDRRKLKTSPGSHSTQGGKWTVKTTDDMLYIDEDNCTATTAQYLQDSSVRRSCSVGYLDLVDVHLVPNEIALLMLRKEQPKRLVLVNCTRRNRKNKKAPSTGPKLKHCGKSRSLDSSDLIADSIVSNANCKNEISRELPLSSLGMVCDLASQPWCNQRSSGTRKSPIRPAPPCTPSPSTATCSKFFFRKRDEPISDQVEKKRDSRCSTPRLPRSSPASPAPSKKPAKRNQSSSPIRKHILNSPLLNRRQRKAKQNESSDDEVVYSGDEVFNGKNYRDLESFQKAQLRQKLKRSKFPDALGIAGLSTPRRREFVMHNKAPMWNENSQVYQLDFGGRVTQESAKNFQIEFRNKQVMQFGRIDGNAYTLDFQYPFSALQAFAVALANVTQRLK